MNPDELEIQAWLEDEVTVSNKDRLESWAATQPHQLAQREKIRNLRKLIQQHIPSQQEPPFPDFFLSKIQQGMRESEITPSLIRTRHFHWKTWLLPTASTAAILIAFSLGKLSNHETPSAAVSPSLYTPEQGVAAKWISNQKSDSPLIVLEGLTPIPDSVNFSSMVHKDNPTEADNTAKYHEEKMDTTVKP